ncbi:MAG: class I SAM-dependent methyltransferase [Actinobacteria bacterium]|nr:class I SAM-dependent methyltransferase [Actinomycetota bacterium]
MTQASLASEVQRFGWYHTLDLGDGVVTEGMFDHRPQLHRYLIPEDLTGMRCLDVGTYDGFWAFEMERRGAAEVVALDIEDPEALDWPHSLRDKIVKTLDIEKGERFALAKEALGSRVERVLCSVYDLDDQFGEFDFVFNGDMLIHLKDPITAVERIRGVCRGSATICNPVVRVRFGRRRALAELDGIDEFQWWLLTEESMVRMLLAAGFARVERGKQFALPARGGGPWRGIRGIVRGYV